MESHVGGRVLIAYASWTGSTRQVAEAIARVFRAAGVTTEVRDITTVEDLRPYTAVVIGSSVHVGKVSRYATEFGRRFGPQLAVLPTAWFVVSRLMREDTPEHRKEADGYLEPLRQAAPEMAPLSIGQFGGLVLRDSPEDEALLSEMESALDQGAPHPQDTRDWAKIEAWAQAVLPMLTPMRMGA